MKGAPNAHIKEIKFPEDYQDEPIGPFLVDVEIDINPDNVVFSLSNVKSVTLETSADIKVKQ